MTLFNLMLQSYTSLFFTVAGIALLLFALGLYFILKQPQPTRTATHTIHFSGASKSRYPDKSLLPDTASDVTAIAGDDPMSTQLDLARAYIETGKTQFAKIILKAVIREGSTEHQEEAQRILGSI